MLRFSFKRHSNWTRVELKNPMQNRQFHRKLSELVMIFFAVVFGVGLAELGKASGMYDRS